MVNISSNLKKLLYSNTLPKAGIKISIKKTTPNYGANGIEYNEEEVMSFSEKDITDISFSQNVDITGSELPSVKLSWEQNYLGEIDENISPIGYYGVQERMAVDFSIIYDYVTYLFWKSFYEKGDTWRSVYNEGKSWRDVFYSKQQEEVKQKRTFLSAFPQVQGKKIRWESRDLLYFLNGKAEETTEHFYLTDLVQKRNDLVISVLAKEGLRLYNSFEKSIEFAISKTLFDSFSEEKNKLKESQIFVGMAKDILKNSISPINLFIDFSQEGGLFVRNAETTSNKRYDMSERVFYLKNQKEFPKVTVGSNISNYVFDSSTFFVDFDSKYVVKPSQIIYEVGEGYTTLIFYTDGSSIAESLEPPIQTDYDLYKHLNFVRYDIKGDHSGVDVDLVLHRIKSKSTKITHKINETGTEFEERNDLNPFSDIGNRNFALDRANFLSSYYNSKNSNIVVSCFGDPSIEPCDLISVETNLKNKDNGENIIKKGIVTSTELLYNGAIKETIAIHELN